MGHPLPREKYPGAMAAVRAWRQNPGSVQACPVCGSKDLDIADRSARPYAEWYVLTCPKCSLEAAIQLPMAGPAV